MSRIGVRKRSIIRDEDYSLSIPSDLEKGIRALAAARRLGFEQTARSLLTWAVLQVPSRDALIYVDEERERRSVRPVPATMTRPEGRGEYTYVGRKRGCGCAVAMAVDDRDDPERVAKYVAEFLASGLFLERVKTEAVNVGKVQLRRCPHERSAVRPISRLQQLKMRNSTKTASKEVKGK